MFYVIYVMNSLYTFRVAVSGYGTYISNLLNHVSTVIICAYHESLTLNYDIMEKNILMYNTHVVFKSLLELDLTQI